MNFIERTSCPCCGEKVLELLLDKSFLSDDIFPFLNSFYLGRLRAEDVSGENSRYTLVRCGGCHFIFQKFIFDDEGMRNFYNNVISSEDSLRKREKASHSYFEGLSSSVRSIRSFFSEKCPRSIKVLDFGMGWGHWALMAKAMGYDAYGAELSVDRIRFAENMGVVVVRDVRSDDSLYDFINTDQVFEHLDDPFMIAGLLSSKLRHGGILKVFTPSSRGVYERVARKTWGPSKDAIQPLEHINCFGGTSMDILFSRVGLVPLSLRDFHGIKAKIFALRLKYLRPGTGWYYKKI